MKVLYKSCSYIMIQPSLRIPPTPRLYAGTYIGTPSICVAIATIPTRFISEAIARIHWLIAADGMPSLTTVFFQQHSHDAVNAKLKPKTPIPMKAKSVHMFRL